MKSVLFALCASLTTALPTETLQKSQLSSRDAEDLPAIGLTNITRIDMGDIKGRSLSGPFMGVNFPDPSIIYGDGSWKAYATSSSGKNVPVATSSDSVSWTLTGNDALPNPGSWVSSSDQAIWAPDVQKNDAGVYVMYYSGVATSPTAVGPFTANSAPLICDAAGGGVIDPSGYDDGVDRWIAWKVDGNNLGGATTCQSGTPSGDYKSTPIRIQRMARDAVTLLDSAKTILDNEGAANDGVVEGPALYKIADGDFVLFYSAHCYAGDDYDIEYAFSSTIDGSYTNRGILLRTVDNTGIYAPGGLDLDPNGRSVVFHGRLAGNQGGGGTRELYSAELSISGRSVSY
ncbi:Uu.00g021130.m01.CDS01 [Anthostomella pinea]|uniref:Uu.00g021130.m01.CDS01 n=1 Tax=Anthostomella pinea TaxID=933095 RepID=A0AAI8W089_9PEZI|nr:Uu.00g021130.m01.CDS01 [Anthostomella pinea]